MSAWTFIAQRATSGEFLDWDVPIEIQSLEWELSGPGALQGTISPDVGGLRGNDGLPILEEWGTLLYAEADGEIRWGGIVINNSFEGEKWNLEAAGFTTYPHARTYRGEYVKVQVDPADVIKHIWEHLQSFPDSNLGVSVVGSKTTVRLGEMAYATDENGVRLDLAVPHKQWDELFGLGWIGGPVHKVHVSDTLWPWLIDHGFNRVPDDALGPVIVPPTAWTEEFPWWESELLNLGWVGGPVRFQDVREELWDYLTSHGWIGKDDGTDFLVYPPTTDKDEWAYPNDAFLGLADVGWIGGPVHRIHVADWLWNALLALGFTGDANVINPPASYDNIPGLASWEVSLYNKGWIGGPVRAADVTEYEYTFFLEHGWRRKAGDTVEQVYGPRRSPRALDEDDVVVDAAPYELLWYESPNCGEEIDNLAKSTPLDFIERHRWSADHESIIHEVELGHPRLGRRRDDLLFAQGDNVTNVVALDSNGDEFANVVLGLGAGEGRAMLRRETSVRDGRLARDHVYADKAVNDVARLDALIAEELNARKAALRITSLSVIGHPNAPLGSWELGDDVLVRAELPWIGDFECWVRITGWALTGENTATLTVSRSDLFNYGG